MSYSPGTLAFQPNATATVFRPTQVPVVPTTVLNTKGGFSPFNAGAPLIWLDGADAGTTQLTSGRVTTWLDKSGNGYNATQGTTANAPTLVTGAQNGLNALSFSGTNGVSGNCLNIGDFVTVPFTMFMVCKFNSTGNTGFALFNNATGTGVTPTFRNSGGSGTFTQQAIGVDFGGPAQRYAGLDQAGNGLNNTNFNIYNFQLPASSLGTIFLNGTAGNTTDGFTMSGSRTYTGNTVGAFNQIPTNSPLNGTVCEIVWYNASLSTGDRQKMEGYLAWKWGVQGQLPAAHPYKNFNIYAQPQLIPLIQGTFTLPISLSPKVWLPSSIPNLALWFDAADLSTITGTSQVTSWASKGSISVSATNRTGSCTSGTPGPNGLNYIRIPAGADLNFTAALTTQARTWFFAGKLTTALSDPGYWGMINSLVANQDTVYLYRSGTNYNALQGPNGNGGSGLIGPISNPLNTVSVYCISNATLAANNVLTEQGTPQTLSTSNPASGYSTSSLTYLIGTAGYNTGSEMYEILFYYGELSLLQRQQVEGYLAWKWGVQNSFPGPHLYKQFPPPPL